MLTGKGWFIWQVARCEHGAPEAIADQAVASGLSHVLIKIGDRNYAYGIDRLGRDQVAPVAKALHDRHIQVWGWHYVYGEQPADEAHLAVKRATQLRLDGYVIDAEGEYKLPGREAAARTFMETLRGGLPQEVPVALSSYRYPSLHRELPWAAFLERCDLSMPQVYWQESHNPDTQLSRSMAEYANARLVGTPRPVIPTGAAYGVGNWSATAADLQKFLAAARQLQVPAVNFYSWDYARAPDNRDLWDTVSSFDWSAAAAERTADDVVRRFFAALNAVDLAELGLLYADNAGQVTTERTLFGVGTIVAWYQELLKTTLPGAVFTLTAMTGTGNSRHASWTAKSPHGDILDGDDTFGILNGRIIYHYTHFSVSQGMMGTAPA
jgi:ketosteroid isomerase-like protein